VAHLVVGLRERRVELGRLPVFGDGGRVVLLPEVESAHQVVGALGVGGGGEARSRVRQSFCRAGSPFAPASRAQMRSFSGSDAFGASATARSTAVKNSRAPPAVLARPTWASAKA